VRLKQRDIKAIKAAAAEVFGAGAVVRLFGSRLRDALRGGDIDLVIEADPGEDDLKRTTAFKKQLFRRIDEQKVDVLLLVRGREPSAFARMVSRDAVPLP
jgi:predicted nucleotidyltransferase